MQMLFPSDWARKQAVVQTSAAMWLERTRSNLENVIKRNHCVTVRWFNNAHDQRRVCQIVVFTKRCLIRCRISVCTGTIAEPCY